MPPDFPFDALDPELLDRYLAGEGTEEENAAVRRYLMARPDAAQRLDDFLRELDDSDARPRPPDSQASLVELRQRMAGASPLRRAIADPRRSSPHRSPSVAAPSRPTPRAMWLRHAGLAAASILVATLAIAAITRVGGDALPLARDGATSATQASPAESLTYATNDGEHAELRLSDGTRVRLAPASRLRVAVDFGVERRNVYLEGEAFFDVTHDEARPFTVFAGSTSAQDLGTSFSVRSYPTDDAVEVIVRDGIVALGGVGQLEQGDLGRLTSEGRATVRRGVDVDSLLGWLEGRLTFVDAPLDEVLRTIKRWHGVEVRLTDSTLGRLPFTGALADASADASIELVAATLGLRVERTGIEVRLSPVRSTPAPSGP